MSARAVFTVFLVCVVAHVISEQAATASGRDQHPASGGNGPRKVRLVAINPAKLYRVFAGGALRQDDEDVVVDDSESYFQKRQQYDDYGHMRFGKRNPKDFDDYGHMRFGK